MGAGIMLLCRDKILIMKRAHYKHDKWSGYWDFPGGQAEPGESTYQTAVRETFEETGISIDQYKVINHVETKIYTMYVAICDEEIVPKLDEEHTEYKWVYTKDILDIRHQLHPKDWKSYKKYYKLY